MTLVGLRGEGFNSPNVAAVVAGIPEVGRTLDCVTSNVSGALDFRWLRDGEPIEGARGSSYRPTNADFASSLSCEVTASNPVGTVTVESAKTIAVAPRDLSGDPRSLVNQPSCRVVGIDPIPGVQVTGTDPATPDSPLTFTSSDEIDVTLGSLPTKTGTRVRFTPRELAALDDGPHDVVVDGESRNAVLAPCRLSTQVNGSPKTRTIYAISAATGIESGSIETPDLRIKKSGGRLTGQATVSSFDEPVTQFQLSGRTTNYNGITLKATKHGIEVSGLPVDTGAVQVRFRNRTVGGRGGTAQARATLRSTERGSGGQAVANVQSAWK